MARADGEPRWCILFADLRELHLYVASFAKFHQLVRMFEKFHPMKKFLLCFCSFLLFLSSCMDKEKPVSLGNSIIDKKIAMTASNVEGHKMDVYLISENEVSGEILAKALNARGQEIGRAKVLLNLMKDDAKLLSFTFDSSLDLDLVTKYLIDFRKQ